MIDTQQLVRRKASVFRSDWHDEFSKDPNEKPSVENRMPLIEKALVSKIASGNSAAFSCVFTSYYKDLVLYASRFTGSLDSSEEIVQDIFIKLWEERESLKITRSLKAYLLMAVKHKSIDWIRHRKIMQHHNDYVLVNSGIHDNYTEEYILYSELQEQLNAAIKQLPDEISEPFRMNRFNGLKYSEIAGLLDVSVRTIEVRIGKALHFLRSYLKDYFIVITGLGVFLSIIG